MDPVAFTLGSLPIRWYGIMAALGFLSGVAIARLNAKPLGIKDDHITDITVICIIAGIVGARIFYVIQFWHRDGFDQHLAQIIRVDKGGLVFYGGLLMSIATLYAYCLLKKLNPLDVLDLMASAVPIGHAFGRVGCFINGCCYGKPCGDGFPLGVHPPSIIKGFDGNIHPVQLYESALNIVVCAVLFVLLRRGALGRGGVTGLYLILYGIMRFSLEFFRGDHIDFVFKLTPAQNIGLLILPLGAWLLWRSMALKRPTCA